MQLKEFLIKTKKRRIIYTLSSPSLFFVIFYAKLLTQLQNYLNHVNNQRDISAWTPKRFPKTPFLKFRVPPRHQRHQKRKTFYRKHSVFFCNSIELCCIPWKVLEPTAVTIREITHLPSLVMIR